MVWIIDGTKNYLNGLPLYAYSIAVLYKGEPVVGAVHLPSSGETGRIANGTYMNNQRVSVMYEAMTVENKLVAIP